MLNFNPSRPNSRKREKINLNFYFTFLRGASKGFTKVLKGLHKTFGTPQSEKKN